MFTQLENKRIKYGFFMSGLVLILAFALTASPAFAGGKLKTYEAYVASIPKGCEPVPRECFEKAIEGKTFAMYDWAAWWPEKLYKGFEKEFGIIDPNDPCGINKISQQTNVRNIKQVDLGQSDE